MVKMLILMLFSLSATSQTVYKTPSGKKYHLGNCRMVENVSQAITFNEAGKLGLEPCKICRPQIVKSQGIMNKAKGANIMVLCMGFTKKGSRCLHRTSIANGFCFQHNPDD